jgi:hypothetical protein
MRIMRSLILFVGLTALTGLTALSPQSASAQVSGTFAFTNNLSCVNIVPPATFNSSFEPTAGPVFLSTSTNAGTITFNSNGTGSVDIVLGVGTFTPVPPGSSFTSTDSSASSWTEMHQFTYTVADGIITTQLVPGSYTQTFLTGPRAGQTASQDVLSNEVYISNSGANYLSISDGTSVETKTYSNGDVRPQVCTRSGRGFSYP